MFRSYFPQRDRSFPHLKSVVTGNGWSLSAQYEFLITDSVIKKINKIMTHCNGKLESILNTEKNTRLFQLLFEHQILPQRFARAVLMEPQLNHYVTALRAAVLKKKKKKCIAGHACALNPEKYIHHILIRNKKERESGIAN